MLLPYSTICPLLSSELSMRLPVNEDSYKVFAMDTVQNPLADTSEGIIQPPIAKLDQAQFQ